MMIEIPLPTVQKLIRILQAFPSIGPRTAQRIAMFILQSPAAEVDKLVDGIVQARERVKFCQTCFSLTEEERCRYCQSEERRNGQLCVVEDPVNVFAIERTRIYHGLYHVLMGVLSPLKGIGPDQLTIQELCKRLETQAFSEVILALNATVEAEATAIYLARLFQPYHLKVTRLAPGIPMGADLEYLDELTLTRALQSRVKS